MLRPAAIALALLAVLAPARAGLFDDPSLLEAWERTQSEDPQTIRFERIEEGLYAFHTERFPFDGELRVHNVSEDSYDWGDGPFRTAVVEIELLDLPEDFFSRHAHSYSTWQSNNMFTFDSDEGGWVTTRTWRPDLSECAVSSGAFGFASSNLFWLGFLLVAVVVLLIVTRKASRNMNRAMTAQDEAMGQQRRAMELMEQGIALNRDANEKLGQILATLREPPRQAG